MVHQRGSSGNEPAEGNKIEVPHRGGQVGGNLLGKPREEQAPTTQPLTGIGGRRKKLGTKHVRRTRGEDDGRTP